MTKLFTKFLLFWLPLVAVVLLMAYFAIHTTFGASFGVRLFFHDLMLFTLIGAVFCYIMSRYITKPLAKLGTAAAGIAEGRLETRVDPALNRRRDEIGDLGRSFDSMAERIEALVSGQRRLLADVSHELRSPLARLLVALTMVKQGPTEESSENLDRIATEAQRLDTLIGQLLTITRIDSGVDRGAPAAFDLANLVQEVASDGDFEARARNRTVVVTEAAECTLTGFEELLRSALENVVRNAIRHTAEGTAVELSLLRSGANAVVRVRDHGPGVPEHLLAEIFHPFRRVSSSNPSTADPNGAGLGLAIAERAVKVHRGSIEAHNGGGGGLVIEIVLPLS